MKRRERKEAEKRLRDLLSEAQKIEIEYHILKGYGIELPEKLRQFFEPQSTAGAEEPIAEGEEEE